MSDWDKFWQDFFTYSGRLSRRRFNKHMRKVFLPFLILFVAKFLIVDVFELSARLPHLVTAIELTTIFASLVFILCIFIFTPRRLHDLGKSGWWNVLLIMMTFSRAPFSDLLMFIFCFWIGNKDGEPGKNKYGDPPPDD